MDLPIVGTHTGPGALLIVFHHIQLDTKQKIDKLKLVNGCPWKTDIFIKIWI